MYSPFKIYIDNRYKVILSVFGRILNSLIEIYIIETSKTNIAHINIIKCEFIYLDIIATNKESTFRLNFLLLFITILLNRLYDH